jgi:hypothetical protein
MSEPVRGVVLAHASLAEGLVSSVRAISGIEGGALAALSNEGCGPESLQALVDAALPGGGPRSSSPTWGAGAAPSPRAAWRSRAPTPGSSPG